jgi:indole-3-glycerol phosphate synthase
MFLRKILSHIQAELAQKKRDTPPERLKARPLYGEPRRGFAASLGGPGRRVIAEIKKASPSQGIIREAFDPVALARELEAGGASALSVLTEERFFQGSLKYLEAIRAAVSLPLLRKDFVIDSYQLLEARAYGADAVLLVGAALGSARLRELKAEATSLGLDALIEVHTEVELADALAADGGIIGINNRDLVTFAVDVATTERLLPLVPRGTLVVSESGIDHRGQIDRLEALGVSGFLVGESLMRAPRPGIKLRELLTGEAGARSGPE